jgi:hypothetical protein
MTDWEFKAGDRVVGLHCHKGKTGTVLRGWRTVVDIKWDGGKRKSTVDAANLKKLEKAQ